ncbi:MAG: hypothetical protein ABIO05_08655 [Ferruginibacter sp.]
MSSLTYNTALIVHTCDRYAFLYKGFEIFFNRYWQRDVHCNYYFVTEEKKVDVAGFTNLLSGKGQWSDRLARVLRGQIKEKYILYFQEDMWLEKKTNANFFNKLFEKTAGENWQLVKLHSSPIYITKPTDIFIDGFNVAAVDNTSGYLMSHQITLWNKQFLLQQLWPNEHPWRNERRASKRLQKINPKIFHVDYFAENGNPPINNNKNPIGRSGYLAVSLNALLNGNILFFIKQLENGSPAEIQYGKDLQLHYDNSLTHDGLPKPRKVDIFKRIKLLFLKLYKKINQ